MAEHEDPIRLLESFGTGGVHVTPLPAAQVRRLGDRRRTRRRAAYAVISAAAVVAAVIPVAVTVGHSGVEQSPPIAHTPSPIPSAEPPAPSPTEITFPDAGVSVRSAADTEKLEGTTTAFKTFIAGVLQQDAAQGCSTPEVTVQKYSSAGYATGGLGCGEYAALWVRHKSEWQEGYATQDTWDCPTLAYFGVPRSFVGDCISYAGDFGPTEVNGLRLGMTAGQVTAAGGTVTPDPAGGCSGVVVPGQPVGGGQAEAILSPTNGLAGIFARPGMKTPEKIGLGSSLADLRAAYPDATSGIDYWTVPLGGGTEYQVLVDQSGAVYEMVLALHKQDCFG